MLTRKEAEEAAEEVLEPRRQQLLRRRERRRKYRLLRQSVVGGVIGLYLGGMLGDYFFGDVYPWGIVGLVVGLLLVALFRWAGGNQTYRL